MNNPTPPTKGRLIDHRPDRRPPTLEDVWDYIRFPAWRDELWRLLGDVLEAPVRDEFLRRPPEHVVGDDLSWLDEIILRSTGRETDIKSLAADRIISRFKRFRACHATRTADVDSYYRHGLKLLDPAVVHARAAEMFLQGACPELSAAHLEHAITVVGSDLREGRVFFEANEPDLLDMCGHYLLYGSEYLIALAVHLGDGRDYKRMLLQAGRPTLFVCDVPLELMGRHMVREFAGNALEFLFEDLLEEDYDPPAHRGAGFCIHRPLSPEYIVGHYHPEGIRDPYRGYVVAEAS